MEGLHIAGFVSVSEYSQDNKNYVMAPSAGKTVEKAKQNWTIKSNFENLNDVFWSTSHVLHSKPNE